MANSLNQLVAWIEEQGPYVLASQEDADFFRSLAKKPQAPKPAPPVALPPPPAPKKVVAEPPPKPVAPPPAPVAIAEPVEIPVTDFASVRNVLSVVAPELAILNEIPNDGIAKKIAERWKTKNQSAPISVLVYQEPPEQKALLEGIAKALDVYFGPAKIVSAEAIEKEKQWEAFLSVADLKMVIVCDYTLWQLHNLMHFYKETPAQSTRMVGNVPLFLLPDMSLYLKDPLLKRSLWKALCQKFS
jgi:hypothetical protein